MSDGYEVRGADRVPRGRDRARDRAAGREELERARVDRRAPVRCDTCGEATPRVIAIREARSAGEGGDRWSCPWCREAAAGDLPECRGCGCPRSPVYGCPGCLPWRDILEDAENEMESVEDVNDGGDDE